LKLKDNFHFYAFVAILCFSSAYVFTRLALLHFSVYSLAFLRCLTASGVLAAVVAVTKMKLPARSDLKWFALGGAAGFFLFSIFFNKGCETLTAATGSVVMATAPIISALLGSFVYQERLKHFQWLAIVISFVGVVVLTLMDGILSVNIGIFWILLAATLLSFYNLLQRRLTKKYSGFQTATFSIFAGAILLSVFGESAVTEITTAPPNQLFYLSVIGVISCALGYLAWSQAFAKAKSISSVTNYMFLTPFVTTLLGFLLAAELPDLPTIVGGTIIFTGLLLFNFGEKLGGA
jgi:drug/metabolite transporter (DMT)-like permease